MNKILGVRILQLVLAAPFFAAIAQNPAGTLDFDTPDFNLKLAKPSQTIASLQPKGAGAFDFAPGDRLENRSADHFNSIGDLNFRTRLRGAEQWEDYSTSASRHPVQALAATAPVLAAADLSSTLPPNCPLQITRRWLLEI